MKIPPLNSEITVEFVAGPLAGDRPLSGILRVVVREPGRVCLGIEMTAGPHDGRIVNVTLADDAPPEESPGFAESDDAGEDWKGHQP